MRFSWLLNVALICVLFGGGYYTAHLGSRVEMLENQAVRHQGMLYKLVYESMARANKGEIL